MQGCQKFVQAQTPLIVYNLARNDLLFDGAFCLETQSIPHLKGRYFLSPIGGNAKPGQSPGFIASNGVSQHPTAEFRITTSFMNTLMAPESVMPKSLKISSACRFERGISFSI